MMKLALVIAATFLTACGSKPETAQNSEPSKPVAYFHVDPATAGKLHGRIVYEGAKPTRQVIDMQSDITCKQEYGAKPVYDEPVVVGKEGGLANAFVYVQAGLEGKTFEPVKDPVVLDQHGCMFSPRTLGVRAAQPLDLRNS